MSAWEDVCLACGSRPRELMPEAGALPGVTSDGRAWPLAGTLLHCPRCGHVQKRVDPEWRAQADAIYTTYTAYPIPGSADQMIFSATGAGKPRFQALLERLDAAVRLPERGRLLDMGCAKGVFLRDFHALRPDWELHGHEYDDHFKAEVLAVPGVAGFTWGPELPAAGPFDCISLQHVLEHLDAPLTALSGQRALLRADGLHFLQVPCFLNDPFDLMITEHCSHFTPACLTYLAARAGFEVLDTTQDWTPKQIGWLARRAARPGLETAFPPAPQAAERAARQALEWLGRLRPALEAHAGKRPLGVFGTAMAGVWTAALLGDRAAFFVDEDPGHQGRTHMDRPVYAPGDVPDGAAVFLAFAPALAARIQARIAPQCPRAEFFLVPMPETTDLRAA